VSTQPGNRALIAICDLETLRTLFPDAGLTNPARAEGGTFQPNSA
jgi:hypothetical protein